MRLELKQTICIPLDHDNDVLVISKGARRSDDQGGQYVRIKVVEGDTVAETEISLAELMEALEDACR